MKSGGAKGQTHRSAVTGRYVTTSPKAAKAATVVLREGRAARVASALSKANTATGLLGREGQTGRSKK